MSVQEDYALDLGTGLRPGLAHGVPTADVDELLERWCVPGVSVAVIVDGGVAWAGGYGRRSAGSEDAVHADTRFLSGSISQSITALGVLCLVARGDLDLDEDVNGKLRSWQLKAAAGWTPRVTVRQLLAHRGGTNVPWVPGRRRDHEFPSLLDVLDGTGAANTPPVRVITTPGLQRYLSAGGMSVLQQLCIDVSGSSFEELMRELVLAPLGMDASGFEQEPGPDRSDGHHVDALPVPGGAYVYREMAAAGLWSTAPDLARFLCAIDAARRGEPGAIIPVELAQAMTTDAHGDGNGLGLQLTDRAGRRSFGRGGDTQRGFVSRAVMQLDSGDGAVAMANCDHGEHIMNSLFDKLADLRGWSERPGGDAEPDPSWAGRFRLGDGTPVALHVDADVLRLELPGQAPFELSPTDVGTWAAEAIDIRVEITDVGGPASALDIYQQAQSDLAHFHAERVATDGGTS